MDFGDIFAKRNMAQWIDCVNKIKKIESQKERIFRNQSHIERVYFGDGNEDFCCKDCDALQKLI